MLLKSAVMPPLPKQHAPVQCIRFALNTLRAHLNPFWCASSVPGILRPLPPRPGRTHKSGNRNTRCSNTKRHTDTMTFITHAMQPNLLFIVPRKRHSCVIEHVPQLPAPPMWHVCGMFAATST